MPKGFSMEQEAQIRSDLISAGKRLLGQYGVRKISIDDAVRLVGIAKGSFYRFFPSKEHWILSIIGDLEEEFQSKLYEQCSDENLGPTDLLNLVFTLPAGLLKSNNPLRRLLDQQEMESLKRMLPLEAREIMDQRDKIFAEKIFELWKKRGFEISITVDQFVSASRAILVLNVHKEELGESADWFIGKTIELFTAHLAGKRKG